MHKQTEQPSCGTLAKRRMHSIGRINTPDVCLYKLLKKSITVVAKVRNR